MESLNQEQLVHDYQALVKSIALQYRSYNVPVEDLVQEGFIGLLEAYQHFDASRQVKFGTYAVFWIKKYILKALQAEYTELNNTTELNSNIVENQRLEIHEPQQPDTKADKGLNLPTDMPIIEKQVVTLSYQDNLTLKEISKITGLTQERIRQIRQKALRRLKINLPL